MISREFLENIESGDLITVRSALLDDLIIDRTFKTFDEDFKAANERLELLVPFDGEPLETDSEKWDKEYLNQQKVALMVNFSEKRIDHLKAVIAKVMPPNLSRNSNTKASHQKLSDSRTGRTVRTERVIVRETEKNKVEPRTTPKSTSTRSNTTPRFGSGSGRTGRRVISETASDRDESSEKKAETDVVGTALIIGGVATTAVGIATAEPIVVGVGVVVAGAGVCIKVSKRR